MNDLSRSSSVVLQELVVETEGARGSISSLPVPATSSASLNGLNHAGSYSSLPTLLQQSMVISTPPLVYIPVSEPSSVQEDRDR